MKYLMIGPYTAVGGVSMHIIRLTNLFKERFSFKFINESPIKSFDDEVFNLRSKNIYKYTKIIKDSDIIHIHTGIWWLRCLHILISRSLNKKTIITIHSLSNLQSSVSIFITNLFLNMADKTIVVSEEINEKIKGKNKIIIPAFIPPDMKNEPNLSLKVLNTIENNKNKKLIVSNAFDLVLHKNEDLYGLDLLIEVAKITKKEGRDYMIIFILGSLTKNMEVYKSYVKMIKDEDLENYISIIIGGISFVSLISKSDIVVRATNTDGDALTIREAIYLGKPIIASDVVKRPKETILFKNRDYKDLYTKIDRNLQNNYSARQYNVNFTEDIKKKYLENIL